MIKLICAGVVCSSFFVPVHDMMHMSDWIGEGKFTDPQTKEFCCGPGDCKALPANMISEAPNGNFYVLTTHELIPSQRIIWRSKDGAWWQCLKHLNGQAQTRCLIGPPRGVLLDTGRSVT